ncbi:MAG: hypothetical protein NTZ97_04405 [Candidatus Moranbacteria bacterium]|nr:hypothetical protein [Candidatus Moranbacteria bacterium]
MENKEKTCCTQTKNIKPEGILSGILYGLIPHSFCIALILGSVIGATLATAWLKKFLLTPHFLEFLLLISLLLASVSAAIYLKKAGCLCLAGAKTKWKYLATLFSTTLLVNWLMFFIIIPSLANATSKVPASPEKQLASLSISVQIPCTGHAPLIIDELRKNDPDCSVTFKAPGTFEIRYDPREISPEKIISAEIFKTYPATINN